MSAKIPCSVSLLTLNAAEDLPRCLESLKDFAEIIVCDGNSTDKTREIALEAGARVIKQYDTDETNLPCVMDKATVRERAMSVSTYPWRFFMDADDTLSQETVDEIRSIVADSNPKHLIWRLPSKVFIAEKEVLHYAAYPAYQTRLVHEKVGAHFRGPVHDRLEYDAKKFPVGTMKNSYSFGWSQERADNYWKYWRAYGERELRTSPPGSLISFLRWGVWYRARIIAGYLLWRLPRLYVTHGFRDSMPLHMELTVVRYHFLLLFGGIAQFFASRTWVAIPREMLRGSGVDEAFSFHLVRRWEAYGRVLDITQTGKKGRYWEYLQTHRWHRDMIVSAARVDVPENHFDTVLLFGPESQESLQKAHSALRVGGVVIGSTYKDARTLLQGTGFSRVEIIPAGRLNVFRACKLQ